VGLILNNGIVLALEGWLEELHGLFVPGYLTAKLIATCVVVAWNYLANRYWTFGPAITNSHKLSSSLPRLIRPQS
jgi:putative flippase GtrA